MKTNNHGPIRRIRVSLEEKVAAILQNQQDSHQVTFVFENGTSRVQELKDAFLTGKRSFTIIEDLKAIQHDLGAKYFEL